jgi:hypothetical protein
VTSATTFWTVSSKLTLGGRTMNVALQREQRTSVPLGGMRAWSSWNRVEQLSQTTTTVLLAALMPRG